MQDLSVFIANHLGLTYALAGVLILLILVEFIRLRRNNVRIDTTQAIQMINRQHAVVIDIRSKESYHQSHIIDSQSIPQSEIANQMKKLEKQRKHPLIFVCQTGIESQRIAASMIKQGYQAYALMGGLQQWKAADLPLIKE
jgi:rhodanese-related sulfurtransferase